MVTRRNVVHSAIFLITALLATAGIFLQLRAEFLFIVQIISLRRRDHGALRFRDHAGQFGRGATADPVARQKWVRSLSRSRWPARSA